MKSNRGVVCDLTSGNLAKSLIVFSLPLMLANVLQLAYNLVDVIVVGHFMNSAGLTGVSQGADIMLLVSILAFSVFSAVQVVIAQFLGRKDYASIQKTLGTMFFFMLVLSALVFVVGISTIDWLLDVINVPESAVLYAKQYCIVSFSGAFFIFGYNMISSILRGMGDSRHPLVFVFIATVVNLILDLLFVAVLGMGTWGTALGTVIGQGVSFLSALVYLFRNRGKLGFRIDKSCLKVDFQILASVLRLAIPLTLQACAVRISKMYLASYINRYGVTVAAINGIGVKLTGFVEVVSGSLSTAGISFVGQNFAAGNKKRVQQTVYFILACGSAFSILLSVIVMLFPHQVFSLFSNDPKVIEMASVYAVVLCLNFIGFSLRGPIQALLNGIGNTTLSMIAGILDGVIARIGLGLLFGIYLDWGIRGFWYGDAFAGYIPFLIGGFYFWSGMWKKRKLAVASGNGEKQ